MAKKREKAEKNAKKKEEPEEEGGGLAGAALQGIGDIIPGLGRLIKEALKTEPFKGRIKEADKEIKAGLKGRPLRRSDIVVERGFRIRTLGGEPISSLKRTKTAEEPETIAPEEPEKEALVDVFDEKKRIRIVTELKGVREKDIKVKVAGTNLIISAGKEKREVILPCPVKERIKKRYKNNILEISLEKKAKKSG